MRWVLLILAGGLGLTGCVREKAAHPSLATPFGNPPAAPPSAVIVTPAIGATGRITSLNPTARYAVLSYPSGVPLPGVGRHLNVYRDGLKVAELKITGPSRDTLTIGDIVAGECRSGDEVRED